MTPESFDDIVEEALGHVPQPLRDRMDNVVIVVEDEPGPDDGDVLGIYRGIDLTRRDDSYQFVMPDEIVIFQGPLERMCRTREDLVRQVRITVVHEVAHHFGISDERLHELGLG